MSPDRLIRQYVEEIWNLENYDKIRQFVHEEYYTEGFRGNQILGPDALVEEIKATKADFDELTIDVLETVSDGTKIVAFVEGRGVKDGTGTFIKAADLWEIRDDKIWACPRVVVVGL